MANPYYIPTRSAIDRLLPIAQLGLSAYNIHESIAGDKARRALAETQEERLAQESKARFGGSELVEPGSRYDTGEGGVMNLPSGRGGVVGFRPGLEQRKAGREARRLALLEEAGVRKRADPLAVHDKWMGEAPDRDRLVKFGQRMPVFSKHVEGLAKGIDEGKIKTRWDAYRYVRERGPEIKGDLDKLIKEQKVAGKDTMELEQLQGLAGSDTFAEQLFQFPAERMATAKIDSSRFKTVSPGGKLIDTRTGEVIAEGGEKQPTPEQPGVKARREMATAKDLAGVEKDIIEGTADKPETLQAHIDFFNQYSKKNYVYVIAPEVITGWFRGGPDKPTRVEKVPLPKGVKAQDIYHTAQKHGLTVEEVLDQLGLKEAVDKNAT